jgi:hypothetical protein
MVGRRAELWTARPAAATYNAASAELLPGGVATANAVASTVVQTSSGSACCAGRTLRAQDEDDPRFGAQ